MPESCRGFHCSVNMKAINLIFLAVCLAEASATVLEPRVVGGKRAAGGQFPYQVSLRTRFTRQHYCGASIISNRFLLTAAHCTEGINSKPAFVVAVVGATRRHFDGVTVKLAKITRHPKWNMKQLINDIALIRTAGEIAFTNNVQPIALPKQNTPGNEQLVLSGWGATGYPSIFLPYHLQYAEPRSISFEECVERFKGEEYVSYIRETSLCSTNKEGTGACHGDSGGPLVDVTNPENKELVGIVSWGIPCAKGFPDVYTRVYSYLPWIQENMEAQSLE